MRIFPHFAKLAALLGISVSGLAACAVVSSEYATRSVGGVDSAIGNSRFVCNGTAGYYNLPKTLLAASITYTSDGTNLTGPKFEGIALQPVGDPDHRYCLTFANSGAGEQLLRVQKNSNDTLKLVSSDSLDQSRFALERIIQTIFVGITGSVSGSVRSSTVLGNRTEGKYFNTFDPFDYADTARFNDRAKEFGFCVFIPGYAFDPTMMTVQQYCNDPNWALRKHVPLWKRKSSGGQLSMVDPGRTAPVVPRVTEEELLQGVLYRPKFAYQVYLMEKFGGSWKVRERRTVMLENISPILSVQLRRGALAQRTSAFQFRDGVLENACIFNSAGAAELVRIPLTLARAIVRLPAEIISVKIGETNADRAIAEVEAQVLRAQQRQLELLAEADNPTPASNADVSIDGNKPVTQAGLNETETDLLTANAQGAFINAQTGELVAGKGCAELAPGNFGGAVPLASLPGSDGAPVARRPFISYRRH